MRVIIDLIAFSLQKSGGISVYWHEFMNRILVQSDVDLLFIDENSHNENIFRTDLEIEGKRILNNEVALVNLLSRYRDIDLKIRGSTFIFHSTYYRTLSKVVKKRNNVKEIVTVHDFTYEYFSSGLKKIVHCHQKKKAIESADIVICISENTKRDLLHFYPEFSCKDIRVVYNGVSTDYFVLPELKNTQVMSPYFLFVGSRAGYKNFDFSVKCIAQTEKFSLKIVGYSLSTKELEMLNALMPGRWEILTNMQNKSLNKLYNSAYALIYPSSYEGFGIPILEAMKTGCPFIALNASSIPEVADSAGVLIERLEIALFNEALITIDSDREELIQKGFNRANEFSWDKSYTAIYNIYKELSNL
jgi:mannosyltransferase